MINFPEWIRQKRIAQKRSKQKAVDRVNAALETNIVGAAWKNWENRPLLTPTERVQQVAIGLDLPVPIVAVAAGLVPDEEAQMLLMEFMQLCPDQKIAAMQMIKELREKGCPQR